MTTYQKVFVSFQLFKFFCAVKRSLFVQANTYRWFEGLIAVIVLSFEMSDKILEAEQNSFSFKILKNRDDLERVLWG